MAVYQDISLAKMRCYTCSTDFEDQEELNDHKESKWHSFNRRLRSSSFMPMSKDEYDATVQVDQTESSNQYIYICHICKKYYKSLNTLIAHFDSKKHKRAANLGETGAEKKKTSKIRKPSTSILFEDYQPSAVKPVKKSERTCMVPCYVCSFCGSKFSGFECLYDHLTSEHSSKNPIVKHLNSPDKYYSFLVNVRKKSEKSPHYGYMPKTLSRMEMYKRNKAIKSNPLNETNLFNLLIQISCPLYFEYKQSLEKIKKVYDAMYTILMGVVSQAEFFGLSNYAVLMSSTFDKYYDEMETYNINTMSFSSMDQNSDHRDAETGITANSTPITPKPQYKPFISMIKSAELNQERQLWIIFAILYEMEEEFLRKRLPLTMWSIPDIEIEKNKPMSLNWLL